MSNHPGSSIRECVHGLSFQSRPCRASFLFLQLFLSFLPAGVSLPSESHRSKSGSWLIPRLSWNWRDDGPGLGLFPYPGLGDRSTSWSFTFSFSKNMKSGCSVVMANTYDRSGGRGRGPGSSLGASKIGFVGDTLWVLDSRARKVHFFLDGGFVRVLSLPPVQDPPS